MNDIIVAIGSTKIRQTEDDIQVWSGSSWISWEEGSVEARSHLRKRALNHPHSRFMPTRMKRTILGGGRL